MRVEIMQSIASAYFSATRGSDFRSRITQGGAPFPFDAIQYETMEKESCIVGMVMAWSVITLESLVNHALAEKINNKVSAIMAIEYPGQITEKLKIAKSARSELAKKIAILSDNRQGSDVYIQLADKITEDRNIIVHDKPFELTDLENGEVKITHFKSRGRENERKPRYENLADFFMDCENVSNYIYSSSALKEAGVTEISFASLINS
ncbi:hypothetical protein MN202_15100 [Rheinheimera muenzenbergensis]|uniref:Uncharacterized protein n=1 Tax=Rheinheimera muenzenbergensis TaxID=1193628 RepID=A0ABU8C9S9_9GAMM